ncbi:MAG: NAD(P)-dependent oxidoreductase [Woeseiaceae bacterium]|nr:NAD(P)-dependent oxidoreductase [Woeseiaceae bacterium]
MKYGVVGASGTLGQVAVRQLLDQADRNQVNALVRRSDSQLSSLKGCKTYVGGIFDDAQLERFVEDSDVIVNLAARNPEGDAADRENYRDFFLVNGVGAASVASAVARHGRPLMHFSSVAVYEANTDTPPSVIQEQDSLPAGDTETVNYYEQLLALLNSHYQECKDNPGSQSAVELLQEYLDSRPLPAAVPVYGLSKLLGEMLSLSIAGRVCAVRMSDVYGPGHESRGVVTDHLDAMRAGDRVVANFDFRSSVYFVFIDDVSRLIAEVADRFLQEADLPTVVNFTGERLEEQGFADRLAGLETSEGPVTISCCQGDDSSKVDRRYDRTVFENSFPEFDLTPFEQGLKATWHDGNVPQQ